MCQEVHMTSRDQGCKDAGGKERGRMEGREPASHHEDHHAEICSFTVSFPSFSQDCSHFYVVLEQMTSRSMCNNTSEFGRVNRQLKNIKDKQR